MSELTDFLAAVEADRERVAQLAVQLAASRQVVQTAVAKASQLGSEDVVARLRAIESGLEQAENGRSMLEAKLEQARVQVDAAIYGNPIVASGGGSPEPHDVDAVPPHVRHGKNPSGDQLMGNDPSIGPFQKEHEGASDDRGKSRGQRMSRRMVRNIEDIAANSKETAKTTYVGMSDGYEPPSSGQLYETVGTPEPPHHVMGPQPVPKAAVEDTVASMVVLAVVAVDAVSRFARASKDRNDDRLSTVPRGHSSRSLRRRQARGRAR